MIMKILDDLISSLGDDSPVHEVYACVFWTAVVSKHCGLASTLHEEHPYHRAVRDVGKLRQKSALEMAEYAKSDNVLEASIGMAAINSLIDINEAECTEQNAFDILMQKGRGRNIAIVGHFPGISKLRDIASKLWVIEQNPYEGDSPAKAAEEILPQADVIGITGSSFINHTVERLLDLGKNSFVVMIGPTTPVSPVLFDFGVDIIAGVKVVESGKVIRSISEAATFPQIEGVKRITMAKEGK